MTCLPFSSFIQDIHHNLSLTSLGPTSHVPRPFSLPQSIPYPPWLPLRFLAYNLITLDKGLKDPILWSSTVSGLGKLRLIGRQWLVLSRPVVKQLGSGRGDSKNRLQEWRRMGEPGDLPHHSPGLLSLIQSLSRRTTAFQPIALPKLRFSPSQRSWESREEPRAHPHLQLAAAHAPGHSRAGSSSPPMWLTSPRPLFFLQGH